MLALADQPLLGENDLRDLIVCFDAADGKQICIPRYQGKRGNPVIFPALLARALRDDPTTPSPRDYIVRQADQVRWFEADNAHFTTDIDTPEQAMAILGIDVYSPIPAGDRL